MATDGAGGVGGAVHETLSELSAGVATTAVGAPGKVVRTPVAAADAAESPAALVATTVTA